MRLKLYFLVRGVILLIVCLLMGSFGSKQPIIKYDSPSMLNEIIKSIANVKTLRYDLTRNERVNDKILLSESKIKLNVSPRKLYISMKTQEVLWIEGKNNGDALINPFTFPYINLNLDPMGALMRKNQHHTIHELGMEYIAEIIKNGMKHYGVMLYKHFVIMGEEKHFGRNCYKLSATFPDFKWLPYTVKKNETIISIANKFSVSEFMILEKKQGATDYKDVKEGEVILVPNVYAKLFFVMIDKEKMLPISVEIFDDKGLFESYEFYNLQVNSTILAEEFTEDYKDYHF